MISIDIISSAFKNAEKPFHPVPFKYFKLGKRSAGIDTIHFDLFDCPIQIRRKSV